MSFQVQARDRQGRLFTSTHQTKAEARRGAACCRGKYPYGNRVRIVEVEEDVRCPECGEWVWDVPKGHKLAKCWNSAGHKSGGTLAFDTMGEI